MTAIEVKNCSVSLSGCEILRHITMSLSRGQISAVIGPNGAGKSTLLKAIVGLVEISEGEIAVLGHPISTYQPELLASTVSYLPQQPEVHWPITVERLVSLGRLPHLVAYEEISGDHQRAVSEALDLVDATHLSARTVWSLSGGERARALLARALAVEAPVLLVDEPVAALDPAHQLQVLELLRKKANEGLSVVIVLHDLTLAARFADHFVLLNEGEIAAMGSASEVLTDDNLRDIYGIEAKRSEGAIIPWRLNPPG